MGIDKIAALKRTALFGALTDAELRAVADRAVVQYLDAGAVLFMAGDTAQGLFVIVEGAVRAFRTGADGREQVIHIERAGATIAEVPIFDDQPYPSTVAAEQASTLLFVEKNYMKQLCLMHPPIAVAALKVLAGRLRRCAELVEFLSLREVGQRLALHLLTEARQKGQPTEAGIRFRLLQTNQQLAAQIGSVREVVSRALTRLHNDGLITLEGRLVTIKNERALSSYAGE